ncbi:MAG: DUF4221 family protein [Bacteroidaceae bacterium]|nr:DUF4221 family protein [Bacteroidaceae bacterium]
MMKNLIWILVILFYSCSAGHQNNVERLVEYDSIVVPIDYPYISDYVQTHCYTNGDTVFLMGYNHWNHAVDLIDVSSGKSNRSIVFEKEGDNGVATLCSAGYQVGNNFVVEEMTGMKLVSFVGKVLRNIPLVDVVDPSTSYRYSIAQRGMSPGNYKDFACWQKGQTCYVPLTPLEDGKLENFSIGAKVNLSNGGVELLECTFPEPYAELDNPKGTYSRPQFTVMDADRIIFNFWGNSHFWIYDLTAQTLIKKDMPSRFTANQVPFADLSTNLKGLFEFEFLSLRFREVHYVSSLQMFVRIHHAPKKEIQDNSNKHYLMLMNEQNGKYMEYLLPPVFSGRYFLYETSLYFLYRGSSDSEIRLGVLDLSSLDF